MDNTFLYFVKDGKVDAVRVRHTEGGAILPDGVRIKYSELNGRSGYFTTYAKARFSITKGGSNEVD